ncbi:MAG: hypothetical protein R3C49_21810 [Planctomycetaceae bacterium]
MLSHPGCEAEWRDLLLARFEDLVLHDGEQVVLKESEFAEEPRRDYYENPLFERRQFQTVHDAAKWIETNWPDFDFETSDLPESNDSE